VVAVGFYQGEAAGLFLGDEFHHNGVEIRSAQIGNIHPERTLADLRRDVLALLLKRRLVLGGLPRFRFPVEEVDKAFAVVRTPTAALQVALAY
jgi:hypothetical protein